MIRRILSLTATVILCFAAATSAATDVSWDVYPVFAAPPQKVIDTGKMVYYVSGGSLFSYDKTTSESISHTTVNGLNGFDVTNIFHDPTGNRIIIAYSSGNIDMMARDGNITNMSDISESSLAPPLTINDVAFSGDRIIAATAFGLVEFSASRAEVVQSGIYNTPVTAIAITDGHILIAADGKLLAIDSNASLRSLSSFIELGSMTDVTGIYPTGTGTVLTTNLTDGSTAITSLSIDFNSGSVTGSSITATCPGSIYLTQTSDGAFLYLSGTTLYSLSSDGQRITVSTTMPDDCEGSVIGTSSLEDGLWTLNNAGIACHKVSAGNLSVLTQRHKPEPFSVKEVCYLLPSADGSGLFVMNNGSTAYRFDRPRSEGFSKALNLALISLPDGESTDLTPYPVEAYLPLAKERQSSAGKYILGPTSVAQDPDDPDRIYISTSTDGVYIITPDGTITGRYNELNSPLTRIDERNIAYHVSIDRGGNLWMSTTSEGDDEGPVFILPANKRLLNTNEVTASDWVHIMTSDNPFPGTHDVQMLYCSQSPIIFRIDAYDHFMAYDTNGTHNDLSDDTYRIHRQPTDQDGYIFSPERYSAICEDRNGAVWIGTDIGVIEIAHPADAMTNNLTVRRLKVPRGDGSGLADYLLDNELVYDITVDAANRKWIATEKSGLFIVSADGSEILANYTTSNSPLPSNTIYCVFSDPTSDRIYVGTPDGLLSCTTGVTPEASDLSSIKVYPNPVRPGYTGPIHIEGLMDGSLVKIANASGSVIHQGRAEGGSYIWEGYTRSGSRPPSGVYFILVSSPANQGRSEAAAAKFMIVN